MSEKKDEKKEKEGEESKLSSPSAADARELEECQKQKEEYLAGWQRTRADFLNYKKTEMERISELLKYGGEELALKILPILDNFEAAERVIPGKLKEDGNVKGLLMIKAQIQDFLRTQGLEEIKSIGENFDPNFHEVVGQVDEDKSSSPPSSALADSEVELKDGKSGVIVEEIQKGYKINGRLLRPAKVKITK